jgi:hypothetical protein
MPLPRVATLVLLTDDILILGVPTVCGANSLNGGCDTGTDWLVERTSRTSITLARIQADCKIWHREFLVNQWAAAESENEQVEHTRYGADHK